MVLNWSGIRDALNPATRCRRYELDLSNLNGGRCERFWRRTTAERRFQEAVARKEARWIALYDTFDGSPYSIGSRLLFHAADAPHT
jgi:hypothetical protein